MSDDRFPLLFAGNPSAYGADHGECIREAPPWHEHLFVHGRSIGVYPIIWIENRWIPGDAQPTYTQVVNWGCIDLDVRSPGHPAGDYADEFEATAAADDLITAGTVLGITLWPEVTRSRGRHLWCFAQDMPNAAIMRRALLTVCDVAGVKATEVNPKQEALAPGSLGNYVRLPYPQGWEWLGAEEKQPRRAVYDPPSRRFLSLNAFVRRACEVRTPTYTLLDAADLWVPPAEPIWKPVPLPNVENSSLYDRLGPAGRAIVSDGPLEGSDRSTTLVRLAGICSRQGLTMPEAFEIVTTADERWGKYHLRSDHAKRIAQIVEIGYR